MYFIEDFVARQVTRNDMLTANTKFNLMLFMLEYQLALLKLYCDQLSKIVLNENQNAAHKFLCFQRNGRLLSNRSSTLVTRKSTMGDRPRRGCAKGVPG